MQNTKEHYDYIVVGSGPAGLGAAFYLLEAADSPRILILDMENYSTGGLRNDCKMNFTYPIGFPTENWNREQAEEYLDLVRRKLAPAILAKTNLGIYAKRAERLGVQLLEIEQTHLGTDGGLQLIKELTAELAEKGVDFALGEEMLSLDEASSSIRTTKREIGYGRILIAPGRRGFKFLQRVMDSLDVSYVDHVVDIGIRIETRQERFPIVQDYYDPKFLFPGQVRTFCTNSGNAHVVQEKYTTHNGDIYYSVNGHAYSKSRGRENGLVNFAMLKTIELTEPVASGQAFAEGLGLQAMLMGGGHPIMQRVGDFRLGKRSKRDSFTGDLYDFEPTLKSCTPGDISLSMPAKILRGIWKSMKLLDTIVPGLLHPSTVMYYPEIKLYANKPKFRDENFQVKERVYFAGDGAGTSRGITAAWASGIRAAMGMVRG
ncbi:pyridine nucleotide-disulfide oxidoreductase [Marispirochaeta aestuarii]|uniref:Pyridine nucleotide-disulfide oxidoreductase n=1 Tax=Marispirochaeta aestuarii TaxID=1963862 RepID=A0A1Y1RTK5_9SPIO|nr:FAD-dependent oxidoreductase [Marispirochaeta aestuarii]ORC30714.1 pyridine nucleotide-disulfide oxidoreductase [Marispirochaeta aestuarii]